LYNSDKVNLDELLRYHSIEMNALILCFFGGGCAQWPISIIVNETKQENECAVKLAKSITDNKKYREIPSQLCIELSNGLVA
jgi:hypothetical protein